MTCYNGLHKVESRVTLLRKNACKTAMYNKEYVFNTLLFYKMYEAMLKHTHTHVSICIHLTFHIRAAHVKIEFVVIVV